MLPEKYSFFSTQKNKDKMACVENVWMDSLLSVIWEIQRISQLFVCHLLTKIMRTLVSKVAPSFLREVRHPFFIQTISLRSNLLFEHELMTYAVSLWDIQTILLYYFFILMKV